MRVMLIKTKCVDTYRVKLLLIGVVVFLFNHSFLANNKLNIRQYNVDSGMCDNWVSAIVRDNNGFLWIGTNNGLMRYDGVSFESFRNNPFNSSSISSNLVSALYVDLNMGVYVGTKDGKVSFWEGYTSDFSVLSDNLSEEENLSSTSITGIYESADNCLLYGRQNGVSAIVYDVVGERREKRIIHKKLNGAAIIAKGSVGKNLLFGCGDSLGVFSTEKRDFEMFNSRFNQLTGRIISIEPVKQSSFLVSTTTGLFVVILSDNGYQVVDQININGVVAVSKGKRDGFWVATDKSINRVSIKDSRVSVSTSELIVEDQLQGILSILEDPQGVLWVGTSRKGLFQIRLEPSDFSSFLIDDSGGEISAIASRKNGVALLSTTQGVLYNILEDGAKLTQISILNNDALQDLGVKSLLELSEGAILIGGSKGAFVLDEKSRVVKQVVFKGFSHFANVEVTAMTLGRKGEVWIATPEGIGSFSGSEITSVFKSKPIASSLFVDLHNNLWIGSSAGLFKKDAGGEVIKKVTGGDSFGSRVLSLPIVSFVVDKDAEVVLGTKNGLYRYRLSTNKVDQLELDNGKFLDGFISNVSIDRLYNVWVTAHNSVYMLGKMGQVRHYGINAGMNSQSIPTGAAVVTSDGKLYVGGGNWLSVAPLLESKGVGNAFPKVYLSNFTLISEDFVAEKYYEITGQLLFKREDPTISFKFVLNDYNSSENNRFKYRLSGVDAEFVELKKKNTLTLSDLSSGDYLLEVIGSFDGSTWSVEPLQLRFIVTPPLYKSGFAIAFYILALLFIAQLIYNVGFRYLLQIRKSLAEEKSSKKLFEAQSVKLALSNKSLTDSINYAKRIQVALLPTIEDIQRFLPKSFLYYKPKDIVSGDFYAVFEVEGKVIVVAADCTGHGVPGAFMSMIGYEMLKNIVVVQGIINPEQILQMMNDGVVSLLRHNNGFVVGHDLDVNDGMDMSVCVIDKSSRKLYFAGAINPLYLIRDNEILIHKGSRYAVGQASLNGEGLFQSKEIDLLPDDFCYLFSDGYIDQFGGAEGKKFKFRRFRHLLLRIHRLGHQQQGSNIEAMMNDWMTSGMRYPQVDDMLILGFAPLGVEVVKGV